MSALPHYEVREGDNDSGFYWVLVAANNQILSTSELYTRKEDAERAIDAAKRASVEAADIAELRTLPPEPSLDTRDTGAP